MLLDELPDVRSQVLQILVLVGIDFFALQRLDEAFAAPPGREPREVFRFARIASQAAR